MKPKPIITVDCPGCPEQYEAVQGTSATCPTCDLTVTRAYPKALDRLHSGLSTRQAIHIYHGSGAQEGIGTRWK